MKIAQEKIKQVDPRIFSNELHGVGNMLFADNRLQNQTQGKLIDKIHTGVMLPALQRKIYKKQ